MPHRMKKLDSCEINTFHLFYEGLWLIRMKKSLIKGGHAANKGRQNWVDQYL